MEFTSSDTPITQQKIITFENGIPGFEEYKNYSLFNHEENDQLYWLRCNEDELIEFACTPPQNLGVHYEMTLTDEELSLIDYSDASDLAVLVTLIENNPNTTSAQVHGNFLGPIIINTKTQKAFQKVLSQAEGFITIKA